MFLICIQQINVFNLEASVILNMYLTDQCCELFWGLNQLKDVNIKVLRFQSHPNSPQVQGESVEDYLSQAQDRQKNAKTKSELAAFNMWKEQLCADHCTFEAARIMTLSSVLKSEAKVGIDQGPSKCIFLFIWYRFCMETARVL